MLNLHTLFIGQRERERKKERERKCGPAEFLCLHHLQIFTVQRERKREIEKEGRRGRKRKRIVILKGMAGALAPFSYLVLL